MRKMLRLLGSGLRNGLVALGALAFAGGVIAVADYNATPGSGLTFASVVLSAKHYMANVLCDAVIGEPQCAAVKAASTPPATTDPALVTGIADGNDVTLGAKADSVCGTSTGTCSLQALVKYLNAQLVTLNGTALTPVPFPINITPTDCSGTITSGGTAQNAFSAGATKHGFFIANLSADPMWISFTTTAAVGATQSYLLPTGSSTVAGGSFSAPPGFGMNTALSVIAATTADKFSCTYY